MKGLIAVYGIACGHYAAPFLQFEWPIVGFFGSEKIFYWSKCWCPKFPWVVLHLFLLPILSPEVIQTIWRMEWPKGSLQEKRQTALCNKVALGIPTYPVTLPQSHDLIPSDATTSKISTLQLSLPSQFQLTNLPGAQCRDFSVIPRGRPRSRGDQITACRFLISQFSFSSVLSCFGSRSSQSK